MNGIDKITAAIISEAEQAAKSATDEARAEAGKVLAGYKEKAEKVVSEINAQSAAECAAISERAASSGALIKRNALLETKSALLDSVFKKAEDALISQSDDDYLRMLTAVFSYTVKDQVEVEKASALHDTYNEYKVPTEYLLCLDIDTDRRIGDRFLKDAKVIASKYGKKLGKSEKHLQIKGGFVLVCGDIELSCSIPSLMSRVRLENEAEVCARLFA